ncbi:unnamed protein product [Rotaria sp. Silwood1]|nr:unnamed protein product [Rotaria sp. Silwood1]CAF1617234.1 unnamed protein product [Rotaria sp. Silwood1]CAF3859553.1 unnamed protein product [Rotaria sp. Silwood1]CAF3864860.1 unnamed protein product [Rotaria sp. Silwood1]CAF4886399.1 unnamed protein product [Rotaria sp. Silwood1]
MNKRVLYLIVLCMIIEKVFTNEIENSRYRRETVWKTTDVLNCIRRLRSIIIRPSKLDLSTEMVNCLEKSKTNKLNKKKLNT